jgi:peptidylprolyl isomerase
MPKTTKRAATKRAARIAKAHATELAKLEVKEAPVRKRPPGYKPPARGVARYPWATILLTLLILGLGTYTLYFYHVGPFALPPAKVKPVVKVSPTPVIPTPTPASTPSPCLSLVKQVTNSAPPPSATAFKQI